MPQLNKGRKFVFGLSVIHENRSVQIPPQAINEYRLSNENKIIIFTGSKITGGFCVTSYPLLSSSKLSHILKECPTLNDSSIFPGTLIPYKGRSYSWLPFNANGTIILTSDLMEQNCYLLEAAILLLQWVLKVLCLKKLIITQAKFKDTKVAVTWENFSIKFYR